MDQGSDEYDSELEAEVDDIMYRILVDECGHVGDDERDSCGSNNDLGDQSSEEEMDVDDANT